MSRCLVGRVIYRWREKFIISRERFSRGFRLRGHHVSDKEVLNTMTCNKDVGGTNTLQIDTPVKWWLDYMCQEWRKISDYTGVWESSSQDNILSQITSVYEVVNESVLRATRTCQSSQMSNFSWLGKINITNIKQDTNINQFSFVVFQNMNRNSINTKTKSFWGLSPAGCEEEEEEEEVEETGSWSFSEERDRNF